MSPNFFLIDAVAQSPPEEDVVRGDGAVLVRLLHGGQPDDTVGRPHPHATRSDVLDHPHHVPGAQHHCVGVCHQTVGEAVDDATLGH